MSKRDEFNSTAKKIMAERTAWRCSFPDCGVITIGPKMGDDTRSINLGEAVACSEGISMAASKGPCQAKSSAQVVLTI